MSGSKPLDELRRAIDAVDDELLDLLNRRAALTIEVGEVKRREGSDSEFYRPDREAKILRRLAEANTGPMPNKQLVRLVREIISTCLSLEKRLQVGYLGPAGTFTHDALLKHFGGAVEAVSASSIADVFREVESKACDYGVVPIENSLGGAVNLTLDSLARSPLRICAEVNLEIHHQLLSKANSVVELDCVYAHEQAFDQCRAWLHNHLPAAALVPLASNAAAAARVAKEPTSGAIASRHAGELYGIKALAENIEDNPHNTTRFIVLGRSSPGHTGDDRTSIMFTMPNKPGALHDILSILSDRGISMSRIESRPRRAGDWDYIFFIDLLGHPDDETVSAALVEIESRAAMFKLLGSCPRAIL